MVLFRYALQLLLVTSGLSSVLHLVVQKFDCIATCIDDKTAVVTTRVTTGTINKAIAGKNLTQASSNPKLAKVPTEATPMMYPKKATTKTNHEQVSRARIARLGHPWSVSTIQ